MLPVCQKISGRATEKLERSFPSFGIGDIWANPNVLAAGTVVPQFGFLSHHLKILTHFCALSLDRLSPASTKVDRVD
jgi:hypothetical protein